MQLMLGTWTYREINCLQEQCEMKSNDHVTVMLFVTVHGLHTKRKKHAFPNNTFIADPGETCPMLGSLE
jgi:hypothetical protein